MSSIRAMRIEGVDIFVEVEPANVILPPPRDTNGRPEGSEPVRFEGELADAATLIKNTIVSLTKATMSAIEATNPNEFSVEIGMTFKGEINPIPVLVKTGTEAAFKVTAKWKRA